MDETTEWLSKAKAQLMESVETETSPIDLDGFKTALKPADEYFARRLFGLLSGRHGGDLVPVDDLLRDLADIAGSPVETRLRTLFDVYDENESGSIDAAEMRTMLAACASVGVLGPTDNVLDTITLSLFDDADKDGDGEISFDQFRDVLVAHAEILDNLAVSPASWLKEPPPLARSSLSVFERVGKHYTDQQIGRVVSLVLYAVVNVILFTVHAYRHRDSNGYIIVARGCGMCLNFNCAFIIVFVLRYCVTLMRSLKLSTYLPLDDNIYFHKVVGVVIVVHSVVHTLAHLANLYLYTSSSSTPTSGTNVTSAATTPTYWECLFTTRCGIGWIPGFGFAYLSGVLLWVTLLVIVVFSLPCVRRGGHFQVFYWTHSMCVGFWILLILHGPIFWMFFLAPATLYLLERIYRTRLFKLAKYGNIYITEVNVLPSKVTHLVIEKPDNFHHQPGDYVYVKIPKITKYEWHPFTISSSPELPDHLWLHIRSMGDWTNKLYDFCSKYKPLDCSHDQTEVACTHPDKPADAAKIDMEFKARPLSQHRASVTFTRYRSIKGPLKRKSTFNSGRDNLGSIKETGVETESNDEGEHREVSRRSVHHVSFKEEIVENLSKKVHIPIYIDGPFGTSTREIFDAEHAVLIGGGVGITPYASILQSIMFRYLTMKRTCVKCEHVWFEDMPRELMKVKKVDFIWVNRDQKSFEWFVSLLAQLEMLQTEPGSLGRILDVHLYMTGAKSRADLRGLSLQIALETMQMRRRNTIRGLKTYVQPGRPDWDEIFQGFEAQNIGSVKVFACGPSALMSAITLSCQRYHFDFCKEHF